MSSPLPSLALSGGASVWQAFEQRVKQHPNALAAELVGSSSLTYADTHAQAEKLSHLLLSTYNGITFNRCVPLPLVLCAPLVPHPTVIAPAEKTLFFSARHVPSPGPSEPVFGEFSSCLCFIFPF